MLKFVVMDFGNYKGSYWGRGKGELTHDRKLAKVFTLEELILHKGLANYVKKGLVKINEA